jgi:hypothetical protein
MPIQLNTRCCIAGVGPAGMMLGFLLALLRKANRVHTPQCGKNNAWLHVGVATRIPAWIVGIGVLAEHVKTQKKK